MKELIEKTMGEFERKFLVTIDMQSFLALSLQEAYSQGVMDSVKSLPKEISTVRDSGGKGLGDIIQDLNEVAKVVGYNKALSQSKSALLKLLTH